LRHVAGARRHDAARKLGARRLEDRVRRAAELERADRLQALELEPDLRRRIVDVQPYERRARDGVREPVAGALDVVDRDQKSTSVPTDRSRARR
jgi:hypothetical protein